MGKGRDRVDDSHVQYMYIYSYIIYDFFFVFIDYQCHEYELL